MREFIGRQNYLKELESLWQESKSCLVTIYGRRRVGKTALIQHFSRKKRAFIFEAIEGEETPSQVQHFLHQLSQVIQEPHLRDLKYREWPPVFDLLTRFLEKEKSVVLCFDELSWMASGRTQLVSYIKYYWDRHWKQHPQVLFILCGSVASWMIKNVVRSKALYGRLSHAVLVEPLQPGEVASFIGAKRGQREVLEYLLCFGGIPRYLEEFDFSKSLQINIEKNCFHPSGFFKEEAEKIFYNQFKETQIYQKIVRALLHRPLLLKDIAQVVHIPSGGGLKLYLDNLVAANIIDKIPLIRDFQVGKRASYHLMDEFLRFHTTFIKPNLNEINLSRREDKFEKFTRNKWFPFLGYAFERFCVKWRFGIANLLGFGNKVVGCGSILEKKEGGFQYDLAFIRNDHVLTVCEVKYLTEAPATKLIRDFEEKLNRTSFPRDWTIEKVLICNQKPSTPLRESGYFHQILSADQIVQYCQ